MKLKILAAGAALAAYAGPAAAATIVLPTRTTADYVLLGGAKLANPPGGPATLLSVTVTPMGSGMLLLGPVETNYAGISLGPVVAGQTYTFTPNAVLYSNGNKYGYWFSDLRVATDHNIPQLATYSNITIELGSNFAPIPEPATWAAMTIGFGLLGFSARRRPSPAAA
ncbi:PEPxxWA-CTERM sorting domain-containing protein [Sphingomonas tabacisoli]|uniref:PEPxxWA-CTERM sorting domain-containing protein n=1 Tax=Sphingomonas tabacisoli TaxID=2249466 RepID=A0ABW4I364_9SPHN